MNNKSFCAFILTHGRPNRVFTYNALKKAGYTGDIVIVIDNEDKNQKEYQENFKEQIYIFNKKEIATQIDEGDNFNDRRAIIYARNACFEIAKKLGYEYFIQLDDDYTVFNHKINQQHQYIEKEILNLDKVFDAMVDYYKTIPACSIAMAQGGDFIGGKFGSWRKPRRKCMNSFICSINRPFKFFGRINEDVNTYTNLGSRGGLFLTTTFVELKQKQTQSNMGGMTDLYFDSGTYVKSFYSVMYQPSSVKISAMHSTNARIHHKVKWKNTVPVILATEYKKI
jgi:hypothetical protein